MMSTETNKERNERLARAWELMDRNRAAQKSFGEQVMEGLTMLATLGLLGFIGFWVASWGSLAFAVWISCVIVGAAVGQFKGESSAFWWAALLGPIGLVVVVCMPNRNRQVAEQEAAFRQRQLIEIQEAQLKEMRELRARLDGNPFPAPSAPPTPAPQTPRTEVVEPLDFIPENLQPRRR